VDKRTITRPAEIRQLARGGWVLVVAGLAVFTAVVVIVSDGARSNSAQSRPAGLTPAAARGRHFHAGFETGNVSAFDQASTLNGSLVASQVAPLHGAWCAEATYRGGGANGYARGIFDPKWQTGDRIRYSAAFRLPVGFYSSQQGQIDLMRWDNFPLHGAAADFGGIVIYGSDKRARLVRGHYNGEEIPLGSSFALPEGHWFTISVFQRLTLHGPLSKVRVDGALVASSGDQNFYGRRIDRIRYGIVAITAGQQLNGLRLWFDDANAMSWR
jgi:hypothetical protein